MTEHRDKQPVGIVRIDTDPGNLLPLAQAKVGPGLPCVRGLVHTIARGQIGPVQSFAAADVDHIWIGGRYRDGADGTGWLVIEDGIPRPAVVVALPNAAVHRTEIENIWLADNASCGSRSPSAKWPNHAPMQLAVRLRTKLLCRGVQARAQDEQA